MDKKEVCEYCGKIFNGKRGLSSHKKSKHRELQLVEFNKIKDDQLKEREKDIFCMICGEKLDNVVQHVFYKHGMTLNEYKKLYPNAKLHKDNREKKILNCPYCNRIYYYNNCLALHIKKEHNEHYVKKTKNKDGITCEICNKKFINFSQHVELTHNMKFDDYSVKFNYSGLKTYVTEDHKNNLSKNKLIFYNETKRGEELKKEASEKFSGKNNIACREDVRAKISKSAIERKDNFKRASRGIHVHFTYNNKEHRTRSFIEFKVLITLLENNISFDYEKERIYYIDNTGKSRYYYPDLKIGDVYYEIKTKDNECINEEKYRIIFSQLKDAGKTIKMLSPESLAKDLNISLNKEDYYCEFAKKLLVDDKIRFIWYPTHHKKSRILEKISKNYLNDKHFNVILPKEEYGNKGKNND